MSSVDLAGGLVPTDQLAFRLLGQGIAYSASPAMMRAAFAALALPYTYDLADVTAADVAAAVEALRDDGVGGANVTTPHKVTVAALVDHRSAESERSGSVNTVVRDGQRLVGHDTDLPALIEAIERLCPGGARRALVLGAGGAARSAVHALEQSGSERVEMVQRGDGSWDRLRKLLEDADLVMNATPIGTAGLSKGGTDPHGADTPIPAALLRSDLAVLDLVYRPSPTRLVREARETGASAAGGAGILLGQGRRSLELWLGVPAPVDEMRAALLQEIGPGADV